MSSGRLGLESEAGARTIAREAGAGTGGLGYCRRLGCVRKLGKLASLKSTCKRATGRPREVS